MDPFIRPALKKVFPELELTELPYAHPNFHQRYEFPNGIPKIHEHDGKPAKGYGLIWQGRLVAFYNYESDLGDGWDDVHKDPEELRQKALEMGANIIRYVFQQQYRSENETPQYKCLFLKQLCLFLLLKLRLYSFKIWRHDKLRCFR